MIRNITGAALFVAGLTFIALSRKWATQNEEIQWREAQRRGDTDWRWGIPGILCALAGIFLIM